MTIAAIDWGQLGELVWAAALAGIAVAIAFSLVILGATRASDLRRDDRAGAATAYAALAGLAVLAVAGIVAVGISIIISK